MRIKINKPWFRQKGRYADGRKKVFDDEWLKKESIRLSEISSTNGASIFLLQVVAAGLNFLSKHDVNTVKDWEKVKSDLLSDKTLKDDDEVRHLARRHTMINKTEIVENENSNIL